MLVAPDVTWSIACRDDNDKNSNFLCNEIVIIYLNKKNLGKGDS